MKRFFQSIQGLGSYTSLSVFLPGLSLALLYMTVLSFDSVTRGIYIYLTELIVSKNIFIILAQHMLWKMQNLKHCM